MNVTVVGTGYVGLVTGACLADAGNSVFCLDLDAKKVERLWQEFRSPDFPAIKAALKVPAIFDGRNLYDPQVVKAAGLEYYPIGRKA